MKWVDQIPTLRRFHRVVATSLFLLLSSVVALWFMFSVDRHRRTIVVDGVAREYLFHVPSPQSPGLKPLVLAYHGFSGTAARMAEQSLLHNLVDEKGFYLSYIEGDPTWHFSSSSQVNPDIEFFDKLYSDLLANHPIDPNRVYAVGMSRGGDFVVYLGTKRSTKIAAVVTQGACVSEVVDAERPFPLMIIVGTQDDRVPPGWFPRYRTHFGNVATSWK